MISPGTDAAQIAQPTRFGRPLFGYLLTLDEMSVNNHLVIARSCRRLNCEKGAPAPNAFAVTHRYGRRRWRIQRAVPV
jgi:hypothetical protein